MHVGLDLVYWVPDSGGSGTYAAELIRALHETEPGIQITAWVGKGAPRDLATRDWGGEVEWVHLPVKSTGSPVHVPVELLGLGFGARRRGCDVVHGLAYAAPIVAPGVAKVVTLLDMTWRRQPESVTPLARRMFGMLTSVCGRFCDRVIAISEHAKADLVAAGIDAAKIDVTPLGVRVPANQGTVPSFALEHPVVLSVGQIAAHKNLAAVIRAMPPEATLVLAGRRTPHSDELKALARELDKRVVFPGFVDDDQLEALYAAADAFVLASTNEGFGLPVAEAMARGVPVACSDASSLPEVAAGAAVLFDPDDNDSLARALRQVLDNPAYLAERGHARAAQLTWRRTAELTLESYRRACA